jgi:hypothetical protein
MELKSAAPEDINLENLESRMSWIRNAANKFHRHMQRNLAFMEGELATIAGWKDMPDDPTWWQRAKDTTKNSGELVKKMQDRLKK